MALCENVGSYKLQRCGGGGGGGKGKGEGGGVLRLPLKNFARIFVRA